MRYRELGRGGLQVSEVGFGAWAIGGEGWGPADDETSVAAVHAALEAGITLFDTADVYGNGHSEEVLGRALAGRRHEAVIATKAGLISPSGNDFSPGHLEAALDASLRRLQTDYVDLFQLHNPTRTALKDPSVWETLRRLKEDGRVRALGVSLQRPADAAPALAAGAEVALQAVFNLVDQSPRALFPALEAAGAGFIARVPLASGFLSGKYDVGHRFAAGDFRRNIGIQRRRDVLEKARRLDAVVTKLGVTRAQAALVFVLSYGAVSATIPGVRTPAQATENAAASEIAPLAAEVLATLEDEMNSAKEQP